MFKIVYHDPVYGQIELTDIQKELLKLPELQRLGWVNQLGLKNMVYRGATHKRIEHSTGVAYLAKTMGESLDLNPSELEILSATGQLHDVAHMPFSHTLERITKKNHMEYAGIIFEGQLFPERGNKPTISEVLKENSINPDDIIELIDGKYTKQVYLQNIIKSPVDADQMDYLRRDALHTGHNVGAIRQSRIIKMASINGGRIVFSEKAMCDLEHFLFARKSMCEAVYFHPAGVIPEVMLTKATRPVLDTFKIEEIIACTDEEFLEKLKVKGAYQKEMVDRIRYRDMFKKAVIVNSNKHCIEQFFGDICKMQKRGNEAIENEIAERTGVDANYVGVEFPIQWLKTSEDRIDPKKDIEIMLKNGDICKLTELRETSRAIMLDPVAPNIFGTYTKDEDRAKVSKAVNELYFNNKLG